MADESAHSDLIAQFCGVTGAESARAKLYLEAAGWDLSVALSSFYEEDLPPSVPSTVSSPPGDRPPPNASAAPTLNSLHEPSSEPSKSRPGGSSKLKTFSDLRNTGPSNADEDGQAFYAGGSEHSGQQVLGPSRLKKNNEMVTSLFEAAKAHGAMVVEPGMEDPASSRARPAFGGTGFRLGSTPGPAEVGPRTSGPESRMQARERMRQMTLNMWRDGFSVDDGPLREYTDPANRQFLQAIQRGEIPPEVAKEGEVCLNMEDRRHEDYHSVHRKPKVRTFAGEGHRLGSVEPRVATLLETQPQGPATTEEDARRSISYDATKPTTQIQIRLADGTRLVAQLNEDHTIADIRRYIVALRPQYGSAPFTLMLTFPNRELSDESATIKDANLKNACIVQRVQPV